VKKISILLLLWTITNSTLSFAREEFILNKDSAFGPTFRNRFSFMLGVNPNVQKSGDVSNLTFSFDKKIDELADSYWLDTNFIITRGLFNKLTTITI
jgi:hypothetical protein